ncbi:type II toxin-antitoxin system RatA family toxin [Aurantivibrio plasticivorans]
MAKVVERSALVPFSAAQMFELVNDIERYPEFMDGVVGTQLVSRSESEIVAGLDIRKSGFAQSFITRNTLIPFERIEMQLVEGPFEQLEGTWTFEALGDIGCKVGLILTFEFKSKILAVAGNRVLESVGNQLVDAMSQRANKRYS